MKKVIATLLMASLVVTLAACGSDDAEEVAAEESVVEEEAEAEVEEAEEEEVASEETYSVGVLVPTTEAEYFVGVANTVEEGLGALGYTVTTTSYDWNADSEIQAIENYVIEGVDAIVIVAFDAAADAACKDAMDAGVKIVMAGTETENHDYQIISDNTLVGECIAGMAVDWVNETMDGAAQIAILSGEGSISSVERVNGMESVLESDLPDAEVVLVLDPGEEAGSGNDFAENLLLRFPDVNVVLSISDDRALEVYESFKAANHTGDDVAIFGCDCNTQALQYIADGTCYRGSANTGDYGQIAVDILPSLLAGEDIGTETVCTGEGVTIANVESYLN